MLKVLTDEASKGYKKKKHETKPSKIMYRYAKLKRFCRDRQLQVYMYVFMYVDTETIPVEVHLLLQKYLL